MMKELFAGEGKLFKEEWNRLFEKDNVYGAFTLPVRRELSRNWQKEAEFLFSGSDDEEDDWYDDGDPLTPEEIKAVDEKYGLLVSPFDPVVDGELRTLARVERYTVVAVMPWDDNHKLIVPLSRMTFPCNSQEVQRKGWRDLPLYQQVFELWNLRTLREDLLVGWHTAQLSEEEMEVLKKYIKSYLLGSELPDELTIRTGWMCDPDLFDKYSEAEMQNFAEIDEEDMEELE